MENFMRLFLSVTLISLVSVLSAYSQREMYPENMGKQHQLQFDPLPRWVTFDMELRGRTEGQTSLGHVSGLDRSYELTRVRGGVTVRPVSWLTGYLQFQMRWDFPGERWPQTCAIPSICDKVIWTS